MNSTYQPIILGDETQWSQFNCTKDALSDFFGWFLQGVLAGIAFTFLIGKIEIMIELMCYFNE